MSVPGADGSATRGPADRWLADAIDQAGDLVFLTDDRERFVYVNRRSIDLLGIPPTDLVGEKVVYAVSPDGHATVLDALRTARLEVHAPTQVVVVPFLARHADETVPLEVALRPVTSRRQVLGCVGIARSVAEQRDRFAQRAASERVAAIVSLATHAADRINNPLAVLITHLGVIERAAAEGKPADSDAVEQMRATIERIADVTKDLATIADTSMQKLVLGRPIIDLGRGRLNTGGDEEDAGHAGGG